MTTSSTGGLMALTLCLGLTACATTGVGLERPHRTASAMAQPSTPDEGEGWWRTFQDPTLDRLEAQALAANFDLAQALARRDQAAAAASLARSGLAPSSAVTGQAARVRQSLESGATQAAQASPSFERTVSSYNAGVSASWELDLSGGLRNTARAARAELDAADAVVHAARLLIAGDVADSYIRLRSLQERTALAERQVELSAQLLQLTRARYEAGQAARREVDAAEAALAQAEAVLPGLAAGLEAQLNRLDVLTGQPVGSGGQALRQPGRPINSALTGGVAASRRVESLRRRPDLIAAERRLTAADARIGVAQAEYYPKLTLQGLLGVESLSASDLFTGGAGVTQGALGLRWRLFDFRRIDAEVAVAWGRRAEALAVYRQAVLRAGEDVENALQARLRFLAESGRFAAAADALNRQRAAAADAYGVGAASLLEVIDADRQLLQAQDRAAQARAETALSEVALFKALGG